MSTVELVNLVAAALISGPAVSIATQTIKQAHWDVRTRFAAAVALSALAGCAQAWLNRAVLQHGETLTGADLVGIICCVFTAATAFYKLYFGRTNWAQALERL